MIRVNKTTANFCAYIAALIILLLIFTFMVEFQQFKVLLQFTPWQIAVACFLSLGAYIGNGAEYYFMCRKMGGEIEIKDILLLPMAMNLAGTIFPVQGAMTYQIFLMKKKYGVDIAKGCSIAAFLYIITMTLGGIAGVLIFFCGKTDSLVFLFISLLFIMSAPAAAVFFYLFPRMDFLPKKLQKIVNFVQRTLEGIVILIHDVKMVALLLIIYVLRLLSMIVLFAWLARCLNMEVYFTALLLLNLWNMLSLLIKFTPNNIGISQLVSGLMFTLIALPEKDGVLLSMAATITFMIVALTLGTLAMGWHFWEISAKKQ